MFHFRNVSISRARRTELIIQALFVSCSRAETQKELGKGRLDELLLIYTIEAHVVLNNQDHLSSYEKGET